MATIRYPSELQADQNTDYLEIKFIRRDYSKASVNYVQEGDNIVLNIPQKITENISQNFANAKLGTLGMLDAFANRQNMSSGIINGNALGAALQRYLEGFALESAVNVANKLGASQLTENGILSGSSGIVYNPNLEVLYEGPDFRSFNFQFALFTKSSDDARAIKLIVDQFRERSLPRTSDGLSVGANFANIFGTTGAIQIAGGIGQGTAAGVSSVFKDLLTGSGLNAAGALANAVTSAGGALTGTTSAVIGGLAGTGTFSGTNRFIQQPAFVLFTYKRGAMDHPFIQPLLPAAINQINFDFTPTGNYTTLSNFDALDQATTIGVTITMQLTEVTNLFGNSLFKNRAPGIPGGGTSPNRRAASAGGPSNPLTTLGTTTPNTPSGPLGLPGGGLGGGAGAF